ncbi:MAG: DMT family transporter [Armatimonadota bacterium]|nr:DMT family transporter [Armatimonadota bacterium]MDR7404917.1 DMT family transporter [Armatimonadota bacterium]
MTGSALRSTWRVEAAMLALVGVWGITFPIVKAAFEEIPPLPFNALRLSVATATVLAWTWATGRRLPLSGPVALQVAALGVVGHTCYQLAFVLGLARTTAGHSALILTTIPLFVAALSAIGRIEPVRPRTWAGIVLALAGVALLVGWGNPAQAGRGMLAGDLLTLLASLCWAVYTVAGRPLLARTGALELTALSMTAGTVPLVAVALPDLAVLPWARLTWRAWGAVAFSGVLAVGAGYVVWYLSVQALGTSRTAAYTLLIPVVAVVAAWAGLGEVLHLRQVVGAAAVLAGVGLARSTRDPPPRLEPQPTGR